MDAQITLLVDEVQKANLGEDEVQQVMHFIHFLSYQRQFGKAGGEPVREANTLLPDEIDLAQDPILGLIGLFADGTLTDNMDEVIYKL
jgi:hypothetical protein